MSVVNAGIVCDKDWSNTITQFIIPKWIYVMPLKKISWTIEMVL